MSISEALPASTEALPPHFHDALDHFADARYDEALIVCERILARQTDCPEAIMLLGLISFELDEPLQAIDLLTRAHDMAPETSDYAEALASIQARLGNIAKALYLIKLALALKPHPSGFRLLPEKFRNFFENIEAASPTKFRKRAERLLEAGDLVQAEIAGDMQLRLAPGDPDTLRLLSEIWRRSGQKTRAIAALHAVLHDEPTVGDRLALAEALSQAGRHDEALLTASLCVRKANEDAAVDHGRLRVLAHDPNRTEAEIDAARLAWCARHLPVPAKSRAGSTDWPKDGTAGNDNETPLSIGFVGDRLSDAETVHMLAPVFAGLARRGINIHLYCDDDRETVVTDQLTRHARNRVSLKNVDPETAAAMMRGDRLDIAVDLSGHGKDNRLAIFAWRPAPICVSWTGSALPTGGPFDFLLAGPQTTPPSGVDAWRLAETAMIYPAPAGLAEPTSLPALTAGYPTFGTAMHLAAIGRATLALWSDLLGVVPQARLLVANVAQLDDECVARAYELLSHAGLRQRVDIVDFDDAPHLSLDFWQHIDIAIDPQPIGSFIRTSHALWMGVPTIAILGERFAGRTGAAALAAAGRNQWIARDAEQACAQARSLLADLPALSTLRSELPRTIANSALADGDALAGNLVDAFAAMRRRESPPV